MSAERGQILVVEDDPAMCHILCGTLQAYGYQTEGVQDGSRAWALVEGGTFDAVVVDLRLRRVQGRDLLKEIRRLGGFLPVVTYLGVPDLSPGEWFQEKTVFGVVFRSGDSSHLLKTVEEACRVVSQARWPRCA